MGTFSNLKKIKPDPWFVMPVNLSTGEVGIPVKPKKEPYPFKNCDILVTKGDPRMYIRAKGATDAHAKAEAQLRCYIDARPSRFVAA